MENHFAAFKNYPTQKRWRKIQKFIRKEDTTAMDLWATRDFIVRFIDRYEADDMKRILKRVEDDFTMALFEIDERLDTMPDAPTHNPFPYLSRTQSGLVMM